MKRLLLIFPILAIIVLYSAFVLAGRAQQQLFWLQPLPVRNSSSTNIDTTTAGPQVIQNNWVVGTMVTNNFGSAGIIVGSVALTCAAVSGASELDLLAGPPGSVTNKVLSVKLLTSSSTPVGVNIIPFSIFIPNGTAFVLTNSSTGSGNSSAIQAGTGWALIH